MALHWLLAALLTVLATPTDLRAQEFSAAAILVHLARAEADPLVGYELSFGSGTHGPFAVWQDARASGWTVRNVCPPAMPGSPGCVTQHSRTAQRVRSLGLGYAQPIVTRPSFSASLRPHIGWSYIESRSTGPGADAPDHASRGGVRAGLGIEMGRPILAGAARLFIAGDVASSLAGAPACTVGDVGGSAYCPRWAESRLTSTLRAGLAVLLP